MTNLECLTSLLCKLGQKTTFVMGDSWTLLGLICMKFNPKILHLGLEFGPPNNCTIWTIHPSWALALLPQQDTFGSAIEAH